MRMKQKPHSQKDVSNSEGSLGDNETKPIPPTSSPSHLTTHVTSPWALARWQKVYVLLALSLSAIAVLLLRHSFPEWLSTSVGFSVSYESSWGSIMVKFAVTLILLVLVVSFGFFRTAVAPRIGKRHQAIQSSTTSLLEKDPSFQSPGIEPPFETDSVDDLLGTRDVRTSEPMDGESEQRRRLFRFASRIVTNLDEESFSSVLEMTEWVYLEKGQDLFQIGDPSDSGMFFIVRGKVEYRLLDGSIVYEMSAGDIVGELDLITGSKRRYTCRMVSEEGVQLVQLSMANFLLLCEQLPQVVISFILTTVTRQWRISNFVLTEVFGLPQSDSTYPQRSDVLPDFFDESVKDYELPFVGSDCTPNHGYAVLDLNAGDIVFAKGANTSNKFYVLLSGKLSIAHSTCAQEFGPGSLVGAISFFVGIPRFQTVRAISPSRLACITFEHFTTSMSKSNSLRFSAFLSRTMSLSISSFMCLGLERVWKTSGQHLFDRGDTVDHLYVVVSGRVRVLSNKGDAPIEFGRGQFVGEMALLAGDETHNTTVIALRDSELVRINKRMLHKAMQTYPEILSKLSTAMAVRLSGSKFSSTSSGVKTIAVLPIHESLDVEGFVFSLELQLSAFGSTRVVDKYRIEELIRNFSPKSNDETEHWDDNADFAYRARVTSLLSNLEDGYDYILFCAESRLSSWTQSCVRQADIVYILADSAQSSNVSSLERALLWTTPRRTFSRKELVLLHPKHTVLPSHTRKWFKNRRLHAYHHIRSEYSPHFGRLARHVTGKCVGLVLSGGGARGLAHMGIFRALDEENVCIDYIAGTSQGAFMGALLAYHENLSVIEEECRRMGQVMGNVWELLLDATFPIVSFFSGYRFSNSIRSFFGDARIEDLWIPFLCITTNVSGADIGIHRTGVLWEFVRGSMSVIGYLPPILVKEQVLIDGGYINNMPVDIMRDVWEPHMIIAVDVENKSTIYHVNTAQFDAHLSGWWLLFRKFLTLFCIKYPNIPTYSQMVYSLIYINNNRNVRSFVTNSLMDIYIKPELGDTQLLDYHKWAEIFEIGYKYGRSAIAEWKILNQANLKHIPNRRPHHGRTRSLTSGNRVRMDQVKLRSGSLTRNT